VRLDLDDGPLLGAHLSAEEVAARARLQRHDVAAQVAEAVRQHARPDQRLQPLVAHAHAQVPSPLRVRFPESLDYDRGCAEPQVPKQNKQ